MVTIYNTTLSATSQRHFSDGLGGGRQRALSQEIIREITSGEKVSSMFIFRDLAGDAVLEKVVQAILRTDDAPAVGRQAGLQNRNNLIALNLSVFCTIPRHDRAGYAGKAGGQIQA